MKHVFPYHLVFITAVILDRVAISSSQIGICQSLRALFILLLLVATVAYIIQHFIKDWFYTHFIMLMMFVTLITYRSLYRLLKTTFPHEASPLGFILLVLLGILYAMVVRRKVWKSVRNTARLVAYFNVVSVVLLIFQLVRLGRMVISC